MDEEPQWLEEVRARARRLLQQGRPAKYGPDLDLSKYSLEGPIHPSVSALAELGRGILGPSKTVGIRVDEGARSATYFQRDHEVVYSKLEKLASPGLVAAGVEEALRRYPWVKRYWFRALPLGLDKYTAFVGAYSKGGAFIWVKRGARVELPVQACLFTGTSGIVQVPHNLIIAEPRSSVHVITGCVTAPRCKGAAHVAATEIYVGEEAKVTWTMIHNWGPSFHVRPRMGAVVEEGGALVLNYVLLSPVGSIQLYPTVILKGRGARVCFRNLALGRSKSSIDLGSGVVFNSSGTRGEIVTRAVAMEQAEVRMRGLLRGNKPGSKGHLECRGLLLSREARIEAYPSLVGAASGAELTHEAAVGRIAEEQLYYLMSRGLAEEEATSLIARGFLDPGLLELPPELSREVRRIVSITAEKVL